MRKFIKILDILPTWAFLMIYLGVLFAYKAIVGLQGVDMNDEGWMLSGYQQIFNDPAACEYQFLYYNTLLVGGLWDLLFGSWGIYGFRICEAICATATAFFVYLLLHKDINRWCILIGVFLFNIDYVIVVHYNSLTALFLSVAMLLFYKGLTEDNKWHVLCAGIVLGFNIFIRLPNISLCSLGLVFIPYYLFTKDKRNTIVLAIMAFLGVLIGIIVELIIMSSLGHLNLFVDNLASGLSAASAEDSTHDISRFISVYVGNYIAIMKQMVVVIGVPVILYIASKLSSNKHINNVLLFVGCLLYMALIWKNATYNFTMYALCYPIFLAYLLRFPSDYHKVILITISILILLALPFGSDGGIATMECGSMLWIAVPLAIGLYPEFYQHMPLRLHRKAKLISYVFLATFVLHAAYVTSLMCYFDSGSRLKKTARPQTTLATTYTTSFKAAQIDTLMVHLQPLINKNDYLLCYQSVPLVNYLTETRPYLGNSWPWTYDSNNMERQFVKAKATIDKLPVIVRNKSGVATWYHYSPDWNNLECKDWHFTPRKIELIQEFIRDNDYTIHWENDLFQILVPPIK